VAVSIVTANVTLTEVSLGFMIPDEHVRGILNGAPKVGTKILLRTRDGNAVVWVWECTVGTFVWDYTEDETVYIISGEVFISTNNSEEKRLGQGDMVFFPGGITCQWRVTSPIRKFAITRKDLPVSVGFAVRAFHKLARLFGLRGRSAL
jgi:uncharacterized cupin superfamily protein